MMSTPYSRSRCSFKFYGFSCLPEDVTAELGINPSRIWREGDVKPGLLLKYPNNGWLITSQSSEDCELSVHVEEILGIILPFSHRIKNIGYNGKKVISCRIYMYGGDRPPLFLDNEIISKIGGLGTGLDIDLFTFP